MKPIIGVIPTIELDERFYRVSRNNLAAIEQAGGIPIVLSYLSHSNDMEQIAVKLDGLYLTGGDDIDPLYFNEEPHPKLGAFNPKRDAFEMAMTKNMLEKNKPVLGVCKGAQILNLAASGDMYQDIYAQINEPLLQHSQKAPSYAAVHQVELTEGSLIHQLAGQQNIRVNSFHHQANRKPGKGFIVSGKSSDGVVEAIESKEHRFALGVQWHPEMLGTAGDVPSKNIYRGFITACES
ncbi:gamma-glutamyl-gamma-aminobutyrate hydrolase family protein [Oceanobacillus sp. FSL H7-0719]|uniref:gamma-glutamyl-gamma-aminobutyrate hydrolase family protein n=1 Tax=Oceanobacillus sp. FSL H7-0719 TaxID=2954507 RepID=UPI003245B0FD